MLFCLSGDENMGSQKVLKLKIACVDTCFIEGDFIKLARDYKQAKTTKKKNYQIEIKPHKRLKEMLKSKVILYITLITKYQILEKLIFSENLSLVEARRIYYDILAKHKNLLEIESSTKIILTHDLINRVLAKLKKKIELHDILNIEIARKASMPIITSETRKIDCWKAIYNEVLSQEEAWKLFRTKI
ncbi:MAG: hypothetical protein ABH821_00870 [archaeon]